MVLAYGYHRTTMDDVARAAEMSRPALYLLFKNKAEIYRAIASRMFERCTQGAAELLDGDGAFGDRLRAAIEFMTVEMLCAIKDSPHGAELLDLKGDLAGELVERWQQDLVGLFSRAIAAETSARGVDLPQRGLCADMLAELLVDGLEGMKMRTPDRQQQLNAIRQMVRVVELVIKP